jgi:hypothetical protein
MKQPFLRDCPRSLDHKLRDLSDFFCAMIEHMDVPASVACPHARIRVGLFAISERSAMAVKGLTVAAQDAMTAGEAACEKIRRRWTRRGRTEKASHEQED